MKELLKKITPNYIKRAYRKYVNSSTFAGKSTKATFTEIYNKDHWKGANSISGTGSDHGQTKTVVTILDSLITELSIKSILDVPCGDFNWMKEVNLEGVDYIGGDIVADLIRSNLENFTSSNIQFKELDLLSDDLPLSDLILVRDCLVHLSYDNIYKAIQNVKRSGSKYLLTTTFPEHSKNIDIVTGDWRTLNLQAEPFNFSQPLKVFNENCTEGKGEYSDKSLALYLLDDIILPQTSFAS